MNMLLRGRRFLSTVRERIKQERETRLQSKNNEEALPIKTSKDISRIRNIGIIAHIDAGKTTTTERMLYYSGALPSPGDIDDGTTTMDYMKQERERGITIRSAAISFNWKAHQINLIDTPGHVDFSGEVARSLRVLDGAVTVLDGVKGVEAQTPKVWEAASRHNIPKLCFINKMDRVGSSVKRTIQMINSRMPVTPLLMHAVLGNAENFVGVVDVITLTESLFKGTYGSEVHTSPVLKDHPHYKEFYAMRVKLIQQLADYDDQIGDMFLKQSNISNEELKRALRRTLNDPKHQRKICPIFVGSAYRNKGVQLLMDAVLDYLPAPDERLPIHCVTNEKTVRKPLRSEPMTGYVFKVVYDLEKGPLAYTRIYSGILRKHAILNNTTRKTTEKVGQLLRVRANQYAMVEEVSAGDIVALGGLSSVGAGDTLIVSGESNFVLEKLQLPSVVYTMPLEVLHKKDEKNLRESMDKIVIEDSSLQYTEEVATGQFLVSGLGELHLEVIRDKLIQSGIQVRLGQLKINFRETITEQVTDELVLVNKLKNDQEEEFQLKITLKPLLSQDSTLTDKVKVSFAFPALEEFFLNWEQFCRRKAATRRVKTDVDGVEEKEKVSHVKGQKRSIRNPMPMHPIGFKQHDLEEEDEDEDENAEEEEGEEEEDEDEEEQDDNDGYGEDEPQYHINTLPFETLYELVESCKVGLLSGKRSYPLTGVQLLIVHGAYRKNTFTKSIMNRTSSQLIKRMLQNHSVLVEPVMEFELQGDADVIQFAANEAVRKRGTLHDQTQTTVSGLIPAASAKGWVKELRAIGIDVSMKFAHYQQVMGVDPNKLVSENN